MSGIGGSGPFIDETDARVGALHPDAGAHADDCLGGPLFTEDSVGHHGAECSAGCGWAVTGCETRAEAGAAFYGHNPRGT